MFCSLWQTENKVVANPIYNFLPYSLLGGSTIPQWEFFRAELKYIPNLLKVAWPAFTPVFEGSD